jgi:hypothetical protein
LKLAKEKRPNENQFSQLTFDASRKEYSSGCWTELCEELSVKYSVLDIQGIQDLLMGIDTPFDKNDFSILMTKKQFDYESVEKLALSKKVGDILTDLYRLGIIGNSGKNSMRFSFRGDDNILIDKPMIVHEALKNYLSIK